MDLKTIQTRARNTFLISAAISVLAVVFGIMWFVNFDEHIGRGDILRRISAWSFCLFCSIPYFLYLALLIRYIRCGLSRSLYRPSNISFIWLLVFQVFLVFVFAAVMLFTGLAH